MPQRRASYFQSPYHQNPNQYAPQNFQQQPFQQPFYSEQASQAQPTQVGATPYDHFAKPQQPAQWNNYFQPNGQQSMGWNQKPNGIMNYFQDKEGQLDVDKMLGTVGQMANTVQQVSPLLKGLGSFMKGFK
ncbi:YppG family protein [Radiobacillus sp. PE A8.2]|uniref:YppG family protein n=1 Tax=Radiobacillus sp. PE A8.2 TaxID=3380349 RepID=UPI00388DA260